MTWFILSVTMWNNWKFLTIHWILRTLFWIWSDWHNVMDTHVCPRPYYFVQLLDFHFYDMWPWLGDECWWWVPWSVHDYIVISNFPYESRAFFWYVRRLETPQMLILVSDFAFYGMVIILKFHMVLGVVLMTHIVVWNGMGILRSSIPSFIVARFVGVGSKGE